MPRTATVYSILLAGASDVAREHLVAEQIVAEWNRDHGRAQGVRIDSIHWKLDALPAAGGDPQHLINQQLVDNADIIAALIWTRFGTPTPRAGSGTAEEIERCIAAGKPVMLYFSQRPVPPASLDQAQYEQVRAFQKAYAERGLYWTFSNTASFKQLFRNHLARQMNDILGDATAGPIAAPRLKLSTQEELALGLAVSDPQAVDRGAWKYPLHSNLVARDLSEVEATSALSSLVEKGLLAPVEVATTDRMTGAPTTAPAYKVTTLGLAYARQNLSSFRANYVYGIRLLGSRKANAAFLEHLRTLPGVQGQTRFIGDDDRDVCDIGLFSYQPFQESTLRQIARLFGTRVDTFQSK